MSDVKLLLVEDEIIFAMDIKLKLVNAGYIVTDIVSTFNDAIQSVKNDPPNLILMDIMLDKENDGVSIAKEISLSHSIPVIFVTAFADKETFNRAKETMPYGYILKPVSERDLFVTIDLALYKHKVEQHLKEKEEWFRATLTSLGDAVITTDPEGKITYINPTASKITSWNINEAINQNVFNVFCLKEHKSINKRTFSQIIDGFTQASNESDLITRQDQLLPIEFNIKPISQEAKASKGYVIVFRDISERKQIIKQLENAKQAAESANIAKSEFLANMSHEIRTPMNGIVGMIDLLKESIFDDKSQQYLSIAEQSANTLLTIINNILDLSKIEAGKLLLQSNDFNLKLLLENILSMHRLTNRSKKIEMSFEIDPIIPVTLQGDYVRLEQILNNLMSNSVKFTEKGSISIRAVALKDKVVDDGFVAIQFQVIDTGTGIQKEKQKIVFDHFTQIDSSLTKKFSGTGLGLAICKQLVQVMGGTLELESELGKGTTVYVNLNLKIAERIQKIEKSENSNLLPCYFEFNKNNSNLLQVLENVQIRILSRLNDLEKLNSIVITDIDSFHKNCLHYPDMQKIILIGNINDEITYIADNKRFIIKNLVLFEKFEFLDALLSLSEISVPLETKSEININTEKKTKIITNKNSGLCILVAEDDKVNQMVFINLLRDYKVDVTVVQNGYEVLEKLKTSVYDLILMDIQMPKLNGMETIKIIRNSKDDNVPAQIPIIVVTAYALNGDEEKFKKAGANDYLDKPVERKALLDKIIRWSGKELIAQSLNGQPDKKKPVKSENNEIKKIINKLENNIVHLADALSNGEKIQIEKFSKQLYADLNNSNIEYLSRLGFRLELAIKNTNLQKQESIIAEIKEYIDLNLESF